MLQKDMTSRERVFAAIEGREFDIYPAINPTSVVTIECMEATGSYFPHAHTSPSDAANLAEAGHTLLEFDSVMPYFSAHIEAAALGCEVNWGTIRTMPIITQKMVKCIDVFKFPSNIMTRPEITNMLKTIKLLKKRCPDTAIIGKVVGPWSMAYNIYGIERLILDTILDPEKTKHFLEYLSWLPIQFAKAQFEAGADIITWVDHVTADMLSPQIYEDIILPIHKKAAFSLSQYGHVILHVCGNLMDRLELFKQSGFKILHIESQNDICKAVKIVGNDMVLTGSINISQTLKQGTLSDVRREVESNISAGIKLISPECVVPYYVSNRNLKALTQCTHNTLKIAERSIDKYEWSNLRNEKVL